MPLKGHLIELRNRLIIAAVAIVLGGVAGWFLYDVVFEILQRPVLEVGGREGRNAEVNFAGVASAFDMKIKMSLFIGIIITSPVWLYQVWAFVTPGLTKKERRFSLSFLAAAVPLFLGGASLAFFALPNAVKALTEFTPSGASNIIPAQDYLTFVMVIILVFGLAFVLPVIMVGLNLMGILTAKRILKSWRIIVLIVFTFAAVATPSPDALSMFFLVLPMLLLFMLAWGVCVLGDKRRKARAIADGTWVPDEDEADE
ncbi:twin-arginine translocase subunit TatC [Saxibacter everestensis]|uniref:Sec-independent protein translocase protein TatC n=1 Tax=Saxibacter everestensis TaxID=2909229 RepID=A0ABY8QYU7_9MICO|nr:twin-arginine translocase subunit TatC [Brevibacteriaceae bacterium ZFBP1038]